MTPDPQRAAETARQLTDANAPSAEQAAIAAVDAEIAADAPIVAAELEDKRLDEIAKAAGLNLPEGKS